MDVTVTIPPKLEELLYPHRYKIVSGGRGSAKSWTFARVLLAQSLQLRGVILCCREIQLTIKDSVHAVLKRQIGLMGLESMFVVTDNEIQAQGGARFIFRGLRTNAEEIKSMEGIVRVWVAQAEAVSQRSWDVLIPTVREAGSEIWADFNERTTDDATHRMFVEDRQPDEFFVHTTWRDNPWFPEVLEQERVHMLETNKAKHDHIYEGLPLTLTEARVFDPTEANYYTEEELLAWLQNTPKSDIRWTAGVDIGFEDADAFVAVLYSQHPDREEKWVISQYKERRESTKELAQAIQQKLSEIDRLRERLQLPPSQLYISSDFGGGGKKIAYDLYKIYGIPCYEPAIKSNKDLAVDVLRDSVTDRTLRFPAGSPVDDEMQRTLWQRDDNDRIIRKIDDSLYHPDALWSLIYALRPVWATSGMIPTQQQDENRMLSHTMAQYNY